MDDRYQRTTGGQRRYSMDAAKQAPELNFTVKQKRLPLWVTPGVVGAAIAGVIVAIAFALAAVRDTNDDYLVPTIVLLGISIPAVAGFGAMYLGGPGRYSSEVEQSWFPRWSRRSVYGRLLGIAWVVFVIGVIDYLRYIELVPI